jgi:hypothetical protein
VCQHFSPLLLWLSALLGQYNFLGFDHHANPHYARGGALSTAWIWAIQQTVPSLTLLVNSKTPWMATLHPTVEGQRDRGCCVKQYSPMLLEIQWPGLNQQSHHFLYSGGEFA